MHYVYVIKSEKDKGYYIGFTENLRERILTHNNGKTKSIKSRRPFKLVYYEAYFAKKDAKIRELKLKKHGQTRELLLKQIENSFE